MRLKSLKKKHIVKKKLVEFADTDNVGMCVFHSIRVKVNKGFGVAAATLFLLNTKTQRNKGCI